VTGQIRLSSPNLPAIPSPRVSDPTLQRTHDAVREVIETIRGTRGNQLDRAVFLRDLVATGLLSFNASSSTIAVGPNVGASAVAGSSASIPPTLTNIVATAGFSYVLLTWDDPQYSPLAYYEIYRLKVNDPSASPGYTADDARITLSESAQLTALQANPNRTAVQTLLMQKLAVLLTTTSDYDYAKSYSQLYPTNAELEAAYIAAATALKAARLEVVSAQSNNVASAAHVGSTPSPVYSDPVDSGATYLYWVRAVSEASVVGAFNAVGVSATTQPDVSGVIDELTSEVNRGVVTDLVFNGLDNPLSGLSLLENLLGLQDAAAQAQQDASDALSAAVTGIPPTIWAAINALYNRLASSVLGSVVEGYKQTVDINTLGDRVASAETTMLYAQNTVGSLSGRIDTYSTQFDTQFASVNTAVSALATADAAFATEITILEGAVYDPVTGVLAAHGRIDDVLDMAIDADSALLTSLTKLNAQVGSTQGQIADILSLQISPTSALASRLTDLQLTLDSASGSVQDLLSLSISPDSALAQRLTAFEAQFAATTARIQDVLELDVDADSVLARALRTLEGAVASATGSVTDLSQLLVAADRVNALKVARLEGEIDATKGSIQEVLDLRVSSGSVLATKLTTIEATAADAQGRVSDVLSLKIDPGTVLAGKLTELEAQTDYASGAVSDMLSLRFTSDGIKDSAYANAFQSFELKLANLESTVQTYTYNVLNDFTDDYGNLTDPVARAGWGVRVEQSVSGVPYVTGFGINQDIYLNSQGVPQAFSEFVVAADRFAVVDPSNPDVTKNSPFIVGPDPDDPTAPPQVWIRDAMISRAAIQSLTAGVVVADMVRAGAFIQTANLYTPTINIGTWELTSGADPMKPQSWVYNPASGRQGNFSVDASGIMHATGAVLNSALVKDSAGNVILDAGNGVYSSALLNDSLYLQALNGQITLGGTGNVANTPITIDALGARATASANVNDWNATDSSVVAKLPATNAHFFHVRLDKANKQVALTLRSINTSNSARVRFHLEVVGATVVDPATAPFTTALIETTEVPTWTTTPIAFATTTANVIAPNGICITQSAGWGVQSNGVDQMVFTLSKLDGTVEFRLRAVEFFRTSASDRRMIVLGDSVAIAEFGTAPLEFWFSPRDGNDYDALLLANGPSEADATRGAPAGTLVGGLPALTVATAVTDFNASNNRNATAIAAPTVASNGTAVDYVLATDGSADVSFEWAWSGAEADIDGFMVYVRQATSSGAYAFGAVPADEVVYQIPANKRAFILFGVPANKYYHFAVRAYRKTDANVAGGLVQSALVRTSAGDEVNGYQPSSLVAFAGNITGTINGTINANQVNVWANISGTGRPADNATVGAPAGSLVNGVPVENITAAITNFNNSNDRNASAIGAAPVIPNTATAIEHTLNADGSANISLDWTWAGTEADIDGFMVLVRRSSNQTQVAYTWGSSSADEVVYQVPANKRAFIFYGVPANFRYYFGIRAYRKVDAGVTGVNVVNGIVANPLMSAQPAIPLHVNASQGYLPSTQVAFTGDIVGSVATTNLNVWDYITGTKPPTDATRNQLTYSASAPTGALGDLWVDLSVTPNVLQVYTASGWQIASNNTTEIGGSGVNHCNPRYTIFNESTLPPVSGLIRSVVTLDTSVGYIGAGALKLEATGVDAQVYLGSVSNDYNMVIQPGKQWIVSGWVMSPTTASAAGQFYIKSDTAQFYGGSFATSATVGEWTRVSVVVSLTANTTSTRAILRLDNDAGTAAVIYFDGLMVEPKVGQLSTPSNFVAPPNFLSTYTGDLDATYGAPAGSLVNGVPVENITSAVTNFNSANDRNSAAVTAPTIPTEGAAIDHTINTDGTSNISFEWAWSGTEGDIDGFLVYSRMSGSSGSYTFGASAVDETAYQVPPNKRVFILFGVPANRYYHFGVRAFRKVDKDVAASGLIQSAIVQSPFNGSPGQGNEVDGYQPSSTVAFAGDVTGTINGTLNANQVNVWENISATGNNKPANGATKNLVTLSTVAPTVPAPTDGDIWIDSDAVPTLVYVRTGGNWVLSANYLSAGSQLSDYNSLNNSNITLNPDGSLNNAGSGFVAPFEPYHAAMWDFRDSVGPWVGVNATLSATADTMIITGTATISPVARIAHGGISVPGNLYDKVRVKYRRTTGTSAWDGTVFYTTAAHTGFSASYRKTIPAPETTLQNDKWYISEWDMLNLTAGGADWISSTITGLRIDFTDAANEVWEVDWVIVGRHGAGEWTVNTINPTNQLTSANIGTYIAQLAVGTLHIGANAVTVPNSATSSTQQTLNTTSWTDLLTVSFTVPSVGLSSIDSNVPIILSWAVEADIQNSGAAVRQWQVLKDGASIYVSNANLLDTEQFCSGVIKDSVNAGSAATFKLQGKGAAGVPVYQKSMWVMAARR
jgi:hypothetical protein